MGLFTDEEIAREHARRRRAPSEVVSSRLECVHCHSTFDPATGGNAEVPLCDHCLHGSD